MSGDLYEWLSDLQEQAAAFAATRKRAFAPHCDQSVLHAPGVCEYCDHYPDWQEMRTRQRIGFTDHPATDVSPCPSTWFRSAEIRNRWPGNRPHPK